MSVTVGFTLLEEPPPPAATGVGERELFPIEERTLCGVGLLTPFCRDQTNDFQCGSGVPLVKSAVTQALGVRADDGKLGGELPWRPEFGSLLHRLQYMAIDDNFAALARHRVIAAIEQWEPRARITGVRIARTTDAGGKTIALLEVLFNIVQSSTDNVLYRNVQVDVPLSA